MPKILTNEILQEPEKILLYGAPKTGKTFLAATAPGDIYFLVVGPRNELKTLMSPSFRQLYPDKKISYDYVMEKVGKRGQFIEADGFDIACDTLDEALQLHEKGDLPIDTLVIENASTLIEMQMNKAMEINYYSGGDNKANKALSKLREDNIRVMGDNDWGSAQSLMTQFASWIFKLPFHVILIAHEWIVESQDRKTKNKIIHAIQPSFIGKHRTDMPRMFDNVWRTTVEGGGRNARFSLTTLGTDGGSSAPTIVAGSRVGGVLPEKMYDADLTDIIEKFKAAAGPPSRVDFDDLSKKAVTR